MMRTCSTHRREEKRREEERREEKWWQSFSWKTWKKKLLWRRICR
jgi:hypothetical protein